MIALCERAASKRLVLDNSTFVVAHPGFVVGEEHLPDQLASAAYASLVEDAFEVLLDGVRRDRKAPGNLCRGVPLQNKPGD